MNLKKILKTIVLVSLLVFIASCQNRVSTPVLSTVEEKESATQVVSPEVVEGTESPTITTLYPDESALSQEVYPAWDKPKVAVEDLTPPESANQPASGKASISGLLYAYNISVPLSDIQFVFMPAVEAEGKLIPPPILTYGDEANGDITGFTDANGAFYLNDIAPGNYYLIINYPDHSVIAVRSNFTSEYRLFEFEADTTYPLGVIFIAN